MLKFLEETAKCYYDGNPIIEDDEFDILARAFGYHKVGYLEEGGVHLPFPMFSLQNVFEGDSLPLQELDLVESPKLDGAAVALIYVAGELKSIITRGDGKVGSYVSHLIPAFVAPKQISRKGLCQVVGELVAPKHIPRARNYAAGALGLKDYTEFAKRELSFVAYGVFPHQEQNFSKDMKSLEYLDGFNTVISFDASTYPKDGIVYRVDDYAEFEALGFTAHHPRGAFALKKIKEGVETTLLDVEWQVGKSGVVSPVAILEPVEIDEVTVSRATLHNIKYIEALGLEIGCRVIVIRAGDIIPRFVTRIY